MVTIVGLAANADEVAATVLRLKTLDKHPDVIGAYAAEAKSY
jgi:hypothetical protein